MEKRSYRGELLILLTTLLWSTGGLFIKLLPNLNAFALNGLRSGIALIVIMLIFKRFPKFNKYSILGGLAMFSVTTLFVIANKMTTAANAIVLQNTSPIFVLIWASIQKKKLPAFAEILVLTIAFFGIVLVFIDKLDTGNLIGNIIAVLSGVAFSFVFFVNAQKEADPESSSMLGSLLAFVVGIPFYFQITQFGINEILPILGLGIFQFGLPYGLFAIGIKTTNATTASIITLIEAVLNPIWVFLIIHEAPGIIGIIGGIVVIGAVILKVYYERKLKRNSLPIIE